MGKFEDLLARGGPLMADGAMGTMLFQAGLQFGDSPETWNVAHPDVVRGIQRQYIEAGSNIVLTNTFGGSRFRLAMHNLQDRVAELNKTAVILLRAEIAASVLSCQAASAKALKPPPRSRWPARRFSVRSPLRGVVLPSPLRSSVFDSGTR